MLEEYKTFLVEFDKKIEEYFSLHSTFIHCKKGCADCCKDGDYPISDIELLYIMEGFSKVSDDTKQIIQENIKSTQDNTICPFLINNECSIYPFRPIICRVHGLAYMQGNGMVKLPECANNKKNYCDKYINSEFLSEPIKDNLDTYNVLKKFKYSDIKPLKNWIKNV